MSTIPTDWVRQDEWHGNPELGYECWLKGFPRPYGSLVPVYLFGKEGNGKNTPCYDYTGKNEDGTYDVSTRYIAEYRDFSDWSYCVSAGASSDLSHSGGFYPECPTLEEAKAIIDKRSKQGKLIY